MVRDTEVFEKWPDKGHFSWCALSFNCKHIRDSFIPSSVTNFNIGVTCSETQHKWGPFCIPNKVDECDTMGYNKCGFAACAYNTGKCVKSITNMVF
jgi:hypothetical protein